VAEQAAPAPSLPACLRIGLHRGQSKGGGGSSARQSRPQPVDVGLMDDGAVTETRRQ
jgi:hypothetical protein